MGCVDDWNKMFLRRWDSWVTQRYSLTGHSLVHVYPTWRREPWGRSSEAMRYRLLCRGFSFVFGDVLTTSSEGKQLKALVTTSSCCACSCLASRPASSAIPSAASSSLSISASTRQSLRRQEHKTRRWPCRKWCSDSSRWIECNMRSPAQSFYPRCTASRR